MSQYHGWAKYKSADIHVDGIFFDDVNGTYSTTTYNYYSSIYTSTKKTMGPGFQHVLLNAGAGVDPRFFAVADEIIVFEDFYYNYNDNTIFNTPTQYWNKSSLLIHHFNSTVDRQQAIIDNLIGNHVQGLYISTTGNVTNGVQYNNNVYEYISNLWTSFCYDMF